ncbi:MAG: hypothetical protein ACYCXZ_06495 [Coriobacteriia bacterium]
MRSLRQRLEERALARSIKRIEKAASALDEVLKAHGVSRTDRRALMHDIIRGRFDLAAFYRQGGRQ